MTRWEHFEVCGLDFRQGQIDALVQRNADPQNEPLVGQGVYGSSSNAPCEQGEHPDNANTQYGHGNGRGRVTIGSEPDDDGCEIGDRQANVQRRYCHILPVRT